MEKEKLPNIPDKKKMNPKLKKVLLIILLLVVAVHIAIAINHFVKTRKPSEREREEFLSIIIECEKNMEEKYTDPETGKRTIIDSEFARLTELCVHNKNNNDQVQFNYDGSGESL